MAVLTAKEALAHTSLELSHLEMLGSDVDLDEFKLQMKSVVTADVVNAITGASVERTVEGASTLTVTVVDHDRRMLRSGLLAARTDVKLNGLWFRLVQISKQGDLITLTFEDREIAVLRTYDKIIKQSQDTSRTKITRAMFILRLIKEVKEFKIPWVIPELHVVQKIDEPGGEPANQTWGFNDQAANRKDFGINPGSGLTIKHIRPTAQQIANANIILDVGTSKVVPRKLLVIAMMTAIQEATMRNLKSNLQTWPRMWGQHYGIFQQDPHYWPASGSVATDAAAFFDRLIAMNHDHPDDSYFGLAERVQHSGLGGLYAQWRTEAERLVTAYGVPGVDPLSANGSRPFDNAQGDYEFYRGIQPPDGSKKWGKENSWDCIQRLASEVNWRAFFVSGTFYYMSEPRLYQSKPIAVLDEDSVGVESIDGEYDNNKKEAELTITCRLGRWQAPPGSVIELTSNMGPWTGRWLVETISRDLYDSLGTITLKKPQPKLPEPGGSNLPGANTPNDPGKWTLDPKDPPPTSNFSTVVAANKILQYAGQGRYRDDNGRQLAQWKKVAKGEQLTNQCGQKVWMDPRVPNTIISLIEDDWSIGTFALCEDHSCMSADGLRSQHSQAQAFDLSSFKRGNGPWETIGNGRPSTTQGIIELMILLKQLDAYDLICNGNGTIQSNVEAHQLDNGHAAPGNWESDHTNHIHYSCAPGGRH